jgi:hypothetical protein
LPEKVSSSVSSQVLVQPSQLFLHSHSRVEGDTLTSRQPARGQRHELAELSATSALDCAADTLYKSEKLFLSLLLTKLAWLADRKYLDILPNIFCCI